MSFYGDFAADNTVSDIGGGYIQDSPSTTSVKESPYKKRPRQTLTPVTVAQILNASQTPDGQSYKLDGQELAQVSIVGVITAIDIQQTVASYTIDDGTGQMSVKLYSHSDDPESAAEQRAAWRENTYVRVVGTVRSFAEERSIVGFDMIPLVDFNEISYHTLQVIYTHLRHTEGVASGISSITKGETNTTSGSGGQEQTLTPCEQGVLDFYMNGKNNLGASIHLAAQSLPSFSLDDIKKAAERLCDIGHLYSTIDEEHFRRTF